MIEQTPEVAAAGITAAEEEAILLMWRRDGHSVGTIPAADALRLVATARKRAADIERHVLHDMLDRRLSEGRRYPRRHMLVAFAILFALILVAGLVALLSQWL